MILDSLLISARILERHDTAGPDIGHVEARVVLPHPAEVAPPPPPAQWSTGLDGTPRTINVGDNSGVLTMVTVVLVLMMISYRHCRRLFATLWQEMWAMRHRHNVFDERTTNETHVLTLMAMQWCMCTGLLLYSGLGITGTALQPAKAFVDTGCLTLLMMGYYAMQWIACQVLGYTFSTPAGRRLFVQGFTASQSLLSFALIIPSLVSIIYPSASFTAVIVGAALYLTARIVFIIKGFRIFYTNFGSLFYFILYLCTLEIAPIILVYNLALLLVNSL